MLEPDDPYSPGAPREDPARASRKRRADSLMTLHPSIGVVLETCIDATLLSPGRHYLMRHSSVPAALNLIQKTEGEWCLD
jgi:hypothetical protein